MEFVPHTDRDIEEMLARVGVDSIADLFEPIPEAVRLDQALEVPPMLSEVELMKELGRLAGRSWGADLVCFAGGGAYEHHVPAVARILAARGEFATSYTPYQPELAQGVLQAVYEFQTMVCELYGMEVANASLYDGASALVEAVNLALRVTKRSRVVVAGAVHPHYVDVLKTYTSGLGVEVTVLDPGRDGTLTPTEEALADDVAAVVVQTPNFFGRLEDLAAWSDAAHDAGALSVAVSDPTSMGILRAPGQQGADVVVGEGAALGNAVSYGGPYVGFFATNLEHVRQVPGRIAGETLDADGRRAYVLTLQAREQHIRRARATSNVCTNQTLMAIAATIHLTWLGPAGLQRLGEICARRTAYLADRLARIPGCELAFQGPVFKEFLLRVPMPGRQFVERLSARGFLCGPAVGKWYPQLDDCVLVAVTETRTPDELDDLVEAVEKELAG